MYFPYLRGRQYELIALRELAEKGLISDKIFPIIEPVSASSTLKTAIDAMVKRGINVGLIINPQVGSFFDDVNKTTEEYNEFFQNTVPTIIVDNTIQKHISFVNSSFNKNIENTIFVFNKKDFIDSYTTAINGHKAMFNIMPDEGAFRRAVRDNRVISNDAMLLKDKNVDYPDEEEYFSEDHLFYADDGFVGFSDYSTIGNRFTDGGFRPYCVVIHIVYLNDDNKMMIRHFKSDSNDDAEDTAGKFYEALTKFVEWNKQAGLNTYAAKELQRIYDEGSYPGLGIIKKLSVMNHLEIVNNYLNNDN